VSGDAEQPGLLGRAPRVEPGPGAQRALERGLGQVFGRVTVGDAVGKKAVDAPDVVVVDTRKARFYAV
jgi:hypothetical protein